MIHLNVKCCKTMLQYDQTVRSTITLTHGPALFFYVSHFNDWKCFEITRCIDPCPQHTDADCAGKMVKCSKNVNPSNVHPVYEIPSHTPLVRTYCISQIISGERVGDESRRWRIALELTSNHNSLFVRWSYFSVNQSKAHLFKKNLQFYILYTEFHGSSPWIDNKTCLSKRIRSQMKPLRVPWLSPVFTLLCNNHCNLLGECWWLAWLTILRTLPPNGWTTFTHNSLNAPLILGVV